MPFALNEATRCISPTKTPEFLAAGLPVVSTAITDVVRPYGERGLVRIAGNAEEFVQHCDALLASPRQEWRRHVDGFLADLSWDRTWDEMHAIMRGAIRSGRRELAGGTGQTGREEVANAGL
jgi:glycosyltransferase involved in cell wall biosynthesis